MLPTIYDDRVFFTFLGKYIDPRAQAIGLNFGFPLTYVSGIYKQPDGILMHGTKEHKMAGLVGKQIGHEVSEYIFSKYKKEIPVSVAHDSACLLLGGRRNRERINYHGHGI